jgi:hypothetical protein
MKSFLMVFLVVALATLVGCNPVCEFAKTGTDIVAQKVADRWSCDKTKLYDFMITPTSKNICKDSSVGQQGALDLVCPIATGFLVDIGQAQIVSKFGCDPAKVAADLNGGASKLCDALLKKDAPVATPAVAPAK